MNYRNFFQLFENKDRLIDKLDLTDEQKEQLKAFFAKHPNYETKVDWNNKDLQWEDFENILSLDGKSKTQAKKTGISGLVEDKDYKILAQNEKYIIYYPLTHLGSKVLASKKVAPYDEAKWCISMNSDQYWKNYTEMEIDFFFIFMFKDEDGDGFETKFAISRSNPDIDPYEEAYDRRYDLGSSDEIDQNDYPDYSYAFFDSTDQEYEDWTGLPFLKEICKVIKATPNYLKDHIFSLDKEPGYEVKYINEVEVKSIKIGPEVIGKTIKFRPGTKIIRNLVMRFPGLTEDHPGFSDFLTSFPPDSYKIELPNSLREIGNGSFNRSGIYTLNIPASVEKIGNQILGRQVHKNITPVITFEGMPKKLTLSYNAFGSINSLAGTIVNWPGTIHEFAVCLLNGKSFTAFTLQDGELPFSVFGIEKVKATDGTFKKVRVFPSPDSFEYKEFTK